jgi:hypothetical protein
MLDTPVWSSSPIGSTARRSPTWRIHAQPAAPPFLRSTPVNDERAEARQRCTLDRCRERAASPGPCERFAPCSATSAPCSLLIGLLYRHLRSLCAARSSRHVHPENLDHQKLPPVARQGDVWQRRYREINDWERPAADRALSVEVRSQRRQCQRSPSARADASPRPDEGERLASALWVPRCHRLTGSARARRRASDRSGRDRGSRAGRSAASGPERVCASPQTPGGSRRH